MCGWGVGTPEGFQDVAFLPSGASFSAIFLKNCGGGESLRSTTCLKTVVRSKQGHAPCKMLLFHKVSFCVDLSVREFYKICLLSSVKRSVCVLLDLSLIKCY